MVNIVSSLNKRIRIITWNCRSGSIERNIEAIKKFKPDIVTFQEVNTPFYNSTNCYGIFDERFNKGVVIATFNDFTINPFPIDTNVSDYFVPATILGPVSFNLLAVWTQQKPKYVRSIIPALNAYREFLKSSPSVVLGDFNSDVNLNQKISPKKYHLEMVDFFKKEFGLVSSYHKQMNIEHGEETHKTFYLYNHKDKAFHFDYCFIPDEWEIENVDVGSYDEWRTLSDHCPVIVDVLIKQ